MCVKRRCFEKYFYMITDEEKMKVHVDEAEMIYRKFVLLEGM